MGSGVFTPIPQGTYDAFVAHLGKRRKSAFASYVVLLLAAVWKEGEVGRDVVHERDLQTVHAEPLQTIFDRAAHAVGRIVEHDVVRRIRERIYFRVAVVLGRL